MRGGRSLRSLPLRSGSTESLKKSKGSLPFLLLSASFLSLMTASFIKNYLIKAPNAAVPAIGIVLNIRICADLVE